MKKKMVDIMNAFHKYNSDNMAYLAFGLGDLCTPSFSIAGGFAHTYLKDSIKDFAPFEKVELNDPLKMVHRSTEMPKCK